VPKSCCSELLVEIKERIYFNAFGRLSILMASKTSHRKTSGI